MSPDDPRHGSLAGYTEHSKTRTPSCESCRSAKTRYEKQRRLRGGHLVASYRVTRRIGALRALGYSWTEIGAMVDRTAQAIQQIAQTSSASVRRDTALRIFRAYDKAAMTPPPAGTHRDWTRRLARRAGHFPPLGWDDIDDPHERPDARVLRRTG